MSSELLNKIIGCGIVLVLGGMLFFGFRYYTTSRPPVVSPPPSRILPPPQTSTDTVSQEYDAIQEAAVRNIHTAVQKYAAAHEGNYPLSSIKDPCTAVPFCLKGKNINTVEAIYLDPIPQVPIHSFDYYYRADNTQKTYCIKTPYTLATDVKMLFQCTQAQCEKISFTQSCE